MDPITCILILDSDNDKVFVPLADYRTNPTVGTVILHEKPAVVEPVIRESCEHWFIKATKKIPKRSTADQIYEQMKREQDAMRRRRENWMRKI
jgi:hypothetical protein